MAACADDQHPSAPVSSHSIVRSSAMGDVSPNAQATTPYAKPQDQVGFTKVVYVGSGNVSAPAGQTTAGSATCPAGSIAISGGYTLYVTAGATSPLVTTTSPAGLTPNPTGWDVAISNEAAGAGAAAFQVYALCAS
jgi:hypothetical protein